MSARSVCRAHGLHGEPLSTCNLCNRQTTTYLNTLITLRAARMRSATARFIARRNITDALVGLRYCRNAISAYISGLRISSMLNVDRKRHHLQKTALPQFLQQSSPSYPITIPGRAVWIVMRACLSRSWSQIRRPEVLDQFFSKYFRTWRYLIVA